MNPKSIALLGSTGSIGGSTLSLVRQFPDRFKIHSLSCRRSIEMLIDQIKEFAPKQVVVEASDQVNQLRELLMSLNWKFFLETKEIASWYNILM